MTSNSPFNLLIGSIDKFCASNQIAMPDDAKVFIPKKWKRFSDLILFDANKAFNHAFFLNLLQTRELSNQFWGGICEALLVKRIGMLRKVPLDSPIRQPELEIVFGDAERPVRVLEAGITYEWNISELMFSAGNVSLKLELSELDCSDEIIVDMFAGQGYFTLPLLKNAHAKYAYAIDWNARALQTLRHNLQLNQICEDRFRLIHGDSSQVAPIGCAQRVSLGLLPHCRHVWQRACESIDAKTGGILHIHETINYLKDPQNHVEGSNTLHKQTDLTTLINLPLNKTDYQNQWAEFVRQKIEIICTPLNLQKVSIIKLRRVKSYGPHLDHIVVDVGCRAK